MVFCHVLAWHERQGYKLSVFTRLTVLCVRVLNRMVMHKQSQKWELPSNLGSLTQAMLEGGCHYGERMISRTVSICDIL